MIHLKRLLLGAVALATSIAGIWAVATDTPYIFAAGLGVAAAYCFGELILSMRQP